MNAIRKHITSARRIGPGPAALLVIVTLVASSCGAAATADTNPGRLTVVTTTSILGDITRHVVGDQAEVVTLIPIGADPHDYQASSQQAASLRQADLVIANGLGLESGLADVIDAATADGARVLEIGPLVDPIPFVAPGSSGLDPHVWLDPIRMATATGLIAAELERLSPGGGWGGRGEGFASDLMTAHKQIVATLAAVPPERRVLVTNHDALGYFAARYGFEVVGVVISGGSTLAAPSSADLARLSGEIRMRGAPAIFAETTEPTVLAQAVADEVGREVTVVELFTGSLGEPGTAADDLIGMLTTNADRIAAALS